MRTYTRLILPLTILHACTCLALTGCGGSEHAATTPDAVDTATLPNSESLPLSLGEAIEDIKSSPVPTGIQVPLYELLQAELVRVITAETAKGASIPPTGEFNEVSDLVLLGDDVEGWELEWRYVNVGDYNLDGMVNISDLTPIGQHYEAAAGDLNWYIAQNADGNADGMITISDITQLGQNYLAFILGFNIYGAASAEGPWELVDSITRPAPPAEGPFLVSYDLATKAHESYRVVPFDSDSLEGQQSWPCGYMAEPAEVTLGTDTIVATQTIGTAGGTITATGGSPIEGVSMTFPPGALPADTVIELGYNDGTVDLPIGESSLPILVIHAGDVYEFAEPAQITVPFTGDEDTIPMACYIHEDGRLDGMQAVDIDYAADTFTFETFHASPFTITYYECDVGGYVFLPLGYAPSRDEFWVKNKQTQFTDGNCLGMSVFAKWYFDTVSWGETNVLYESYRNVVHWDPPLRFCQDLIATRAQLAVHRYYKDYAPAIIGRGYVASHQYNYNAIINMLEITGLPQVVLLDSSAGRHVVLAYAIRLVTYNPNQVELWIYDPNFPGAARILKYNQATEAFKPYVSGSTTYTKFIHFGTGTIRYAESFDDILADAAQNFNGSADATIEIQSHTDGETVTTLLADVSGVVHSGEALVEKLTIKNGNEVVEVELGVNGEFREDVPMHEGTNYLTFHAQGYNEDNRLLTIHNNLLTSGFILIGEFPPVEITITSHTDGQTVYNRQAQVAGSIISDQIQVDQVHVFTNGTGPFISEVAEGGQFEVSLPLLWGENRLEFNLYGLVAGDQYVNIPHNRTTPFILQAEFTGNAITATMHMDHRLDDSHCMNLYVIDPTGDCSWVLFPLTNDGGHLQTGYGPSSFYQEWILEYSDTVRWGEEYKVRVHWSKGLQHGGGILEPPVLYDVLITLNEGYAAQEVIHRMGAITGPQDCWNDECDATGPDWVDIAVVSPTEP